MNHIVVLIRGGVNFRYRVASRFDLQQHARLASPRVLEAWETHFSDVIQSVAEIDRIGNIIGFVVLDRVLNNYCIAQSKAACRKDVFVNEHV